MSGWEKVGESPAGSDFMPGSDIIKARVGAFTLTLRQPASANTFGIGWHVRCDPPIFAARELPNAHGIDAQDDAVRMLSNALKAADRAVLRLLPPDERAQQSAPSVITSIGACCQPAVVSYCGSAEEEAPPHRYRIRLHWSDDRTTVTHPREQHEDAYVDAQMVIDRVGANALKVVTSTLEEYVEPFGWTEAVGYEDTLEYEGDDGIDS
jgi:hypothetical protein